MAKEKSSCKKCERGGKCSLNYWVIILLGIAFSGVMIGVFAIINCCVSKRQETTWLDGGAWVALVVGSLGAVTTAILGYVAVWQNKKQREDYLLETQKADKEVKFNVLVNNMKKYYGNLKEIDVVLKCNNIKISNIDLSSIIYECFDKYEKRDKEYSTLVQKISTKLLEKVEDMQNIKNVVLCNNYYITQLDELVNVVVKLRKSYRSLFKKFVSYFDNQSKGTYEKKDIIENLKDIVKLTNAFYIKWGLYLLLLFAYIEEIELENDLEKTKLYIADSQKTISELIRKVNELEKEEATSFKENTNE